MPKTHTVAHGEHIPGIAAQNGFADFHKIWDDPENAALKAERKNPNVLMPGDKVFIPDKEVKEESGSTEQRHRFVQTVTKLKLRIKLLNLKDELILRTGKAATRSGEQEITPQGELYELDIHPLDNEVIFNFEEEPPLKLTLDVGGLAPVSNRLGQQQRLNNLGYFAGFSTTPDEEQFQWAVEEYQCDRKKKGLKVTGVCDPEKTQPMLEKDHGV
jgi:hypothetical protein